MTRRRTFLASAIMLLGGCAQLVPYGSGWTDEQKADMDVWSGQVQQHITAVLARDGIHLRPTRAGEPPGIDDFVLLVTVDPYGRIELVKVEDESAKPGLERFIMRKIVAAGPLPEPPSSVSRLYRRVTSRIKFTVHGPRPKAPPAA